MASWMLGIDTGGRFTDPIAVDAESGARRLAKLSSDPSDIGFLVHGTTVATNAPVGGKGVVDKTGRIVVSYARPTFGRRLRVSVTAEVRGPRRKSWRGWSAKTIR